MRKLILILITIISVFSCREDDCFTPPETTVFQFVDVNGADLIKNGTIAVSDIFIQENLGNGNSNGVQFERVEDGKIALKNVGFNDGVKYYDVFLKVETAVKQFSFSLKSSKITGKCGGYKVENITFENVTAVKENGYYKIIIE